MIAHLWHRLQLLFAQGTGQLTTHDKVQIVVLDGEIPPDINRIEPYGFSYRPVDAGFQAYVIFPAGDRSKGLAIVVGDKQYQLELLPGEVALHDHQGQKVHLTSTGIVIDGAGKPITITNTPKVRMETELLEITGDIIDRADAAGSSMHSMRTTYDTHTHPGDSGGTTGAPNQGM